MVLPDFYDALRQLDSLTGETTADSILHIIFSSLCIGKGVSVSSEGLLMALDRMVNLRWELAAAIAPAFACAYYVCSLVLTYSRIPERVAVHFGLDGRPDGWMNRGTWAAVSVVLMALVVAPIVALPPGLGVAAFVQRGVSGGDIGCFQ